jgi:hypothetical protein
MYSTLPTLFTNVKAVSRHANKHKNRHSKHAADVKKMQKYIRNLIPQIKIQRLVAKRWSDKLARYQIQRSTTKRQQLDFYI